jgi:hypothetical protein
VATPLAELVRGGELRGVVPLEEAAKNLADGSAGMTIGFDADADVHAVGGFGKGGYPLRSRRYKMLW